MAKRSAEQQGLMMGRWQRARQGLGLWLAVLLFFAAQASLAEAQQPGSGELRFVGASDGHGGLLLSTDYQVQVSGLLAETRLQQRFRNPSREWQEAVYVFPLPADASVHGLRIKAGDREIIGEIQPREQVHRQYQQARAAGQRVAAVEQQRPNLFTTRIANIAPGALVTVELDYQQPVSYRSGEFELRLPTTLTPRFMPGEPLLADIAPGAWQQGWALPTQQVPDADQISPFTVSRDSLSADSHQARVRIKLTPGIPVDRVTSPTHALSSQWQDPHILVAPQQGAITMDRDLVVRWQAVRGQSPQAAVFHEHWQGEDYLMALLVPGQVGSVRAARELLLVVDTSGSMSGERMRQARQAVLQGLETLTPADRFDIIEFNSHTSRLFASPRPATEANLATARQFARSLNARGGTVMAPALRAALMDQPTTETPSHVRQVLFITDGAVGNEAELLAQIHRELGAARLFTVGIGAATNQHFLREAARFGRGSYTAIDGAEDVALRLASLLTAMQAPVLTDIQVDWPGPGRDVTAFPARPGDLFRGEPLVQAVRGVAPRGQVTVRGRLPDGQPWHQPLSLDQAAPMTGLHRHWARQQIDAWQDEQFQGVSREQIRERVLPLALQHQLVTPYTSFIAIDRTPVRPLDVPLQSDAVPSLLPADNQPGMLRYPQTATPAPLLIQLGGGGLLLSLVVLWLRRRAV